GKARPELFIDDKVFGFYFLQTLDSYWSLPSSLISTFTALFMALCFIFPRYWFGFIIALILLSLTRLVVTAHYLSDILASLYIATLIVILLHKLFKNRQWI
ncbi:MAG: phosphatase PAP2 family protein, partial [Gammaproteobacteria bacterium]